MKFGQRLQAESEDFGVVDAELGKNVLAYCTLKGMLKEGEEGQGADMFWEELQSEVQKLDEFYGARFNELKERACGVQDGGSISETEKLQSDLEALQRWVELNHIALVKIYKKYVRTYHQRNAWGSPTKLPLLFQRSFFEEDSELTRLHNQVSSIVSAYIARTHCPLCNGPSPCPSTGCQQLKDQLTTACHTIVPGWEGAEFNIRILTGGLSNKLYTVERTEPQEDGVKKVVVRMLGSGDLVDRAKEAVIVKRLSEIGVGPRLFGSFANGRIEEFSNGLALRFYHLKKPQILQQVAQKMADFHKIDIPAISREPSLFDIMEGYLVSAKKVSFADETQDIPGGEPVLKKDLLAKMRDLGELEAEVEFLRQKVGGFTASGVSFCHCDVQEGNILTENLHSEEPEVTLIDFEYSRYDYEAFDIGNYFCEAYLDNFFPEHPGFRCHPQLALSTDAQKDFINAYILQKTGSLPTPETLETYLYECRVMMLASHLHWCLWSLIQSAASSIEGFCYLTYAAARLSEYRRLKPSVM
eukprot:TRINITY_DN7877_c1_g1_i1.p1 TRINITY_DN7877_c1_g1~~TRINITY_DN7877_c1_g1_i1.p1  ORF type:complete len:528 (+),score=214.73 TRINITY_DN7877_c1_g1_i1:826-2409(+)